MRDEGDEIKILIVSVHIEKALPDDLGGAFVVYISSGNINELINP